jgi:hypothetical protein
LLYSIRLEPYFSDAMVKPAEEWRPPFLEWQVAERDQS